MRNEVHITGDLKSARIEDKRNKFVADITKDMAIIELRGQTFRMNASDWYNMEIVVELAKQIRLDAGVEDGK